MRKRDDGIYFLIDGQKIIGIQTDFIAALTLATRLGVNLYYAEKIETLTPTMATKTQ